MNSDIYSMLRFMVASSPKAPLSEEERLIRKTERLKVSEERIRRARILENICPSCKGKLVRGKKDKLNDYKRVWKCSSCHTSFSI